NDKVLLASWQYLYELFIDHINSIEYNNDIKYFDPIKSSVICVDILDPQLKKKLSKNDLDDLSKKLSISINDSNALHVKSYVDDILNWYTGLNTAPLCNNSKKPEISSSCSHEEKIQYKISKQQYTSDTIYSFIFRSIRHINDNLYTLFSEITSTGFTQRKCLYKLLGLNKKKSAIGRRCDLILCDQYDYVHLVGEKTMETSVLDHMMQQIYRSRLLNRAEIPLNKKITDKIAIAENANKMDKLINKLSKKKQEWKANNINTDFDSLTITITLSTLLSSPSSDDTPDSTKASIHVFATNTILHIPERLPISADDDDSIPDIKI
ncbi:8295_t:CDS:2, partial [Racocetra persica]